MTTPTPEPLPVVDLVAAAVLSVPGVTGLHAGSFGEVGTYLPGRRVAGVRLADDVAQVHVAVAMGRPLLAVAEAVRAAVAPLVATPVEVVVEDVTSAAEQRLQEADAHATDPDATGPQATGASGDDATDPEGLGFPAPQEPTEG